MHGRSNIFSSNEKLNALFIFGACGLISVLLDFDHVPVLISKGIEITAENLITRSSRPFHYPFFIFLGLIFLYFSASYYRLLRKRV